MDLISALTDLLKTPGVIVLLTMLGLPLLAFLGISVYKNGNNWTIGKPQASIDDIQKEERKKLKRVKLNLEIKDLRWKQSNLKQEKIKDILRVCDDEYVCIGNYLKDNFRKFLQASQRGYSFKPAGVNDQNGKPLYEPYIEADPCNSPAYIDFAKSIDLIKAFVMAECTRMVQDNNFLLKEQNGEKDKYTEFQVNNIFDIVPSKLTDFYKAQYPPRNIMQKWASENLDFNFIKNEIRKAVTYCFIAAKTYANLEQQYELEIDRLEEELFEWGV